MENHNLESEKSFALLDADNKVIIVVAVLGNDEPLLAILAEHWGATTWRDTEIYGITSAGGSFDGEKLLLPPDLIPTEPVPTEE
jgi:hypothetical protein